MISPCDSCKYRQYNLDPYGCWKMVDMTGYFGRVYRKLFGCDWYDV